MDAWLLKHETLMELVAGTVVRLLGVKNPEVVAREFHVSRQTIHDWLAGYRNRDGRTLGSVSTHLAIRKGLHEDDL